ncbi:MAG: peptide transporter permease [Myxococcaceae bacterium]|nr:peptide transporter permease [Myxococcaceae bacterium]
MTRAILSRLVASFGVVLGAVTLIFLILNWLPGDAAAMIAGENASAETIERVREQLGAARPLATQYVDYLAALVHGDLGRSYITHEPVVDRLLQQFPSTAWLAGLAALFAVVVGVGLGVLSARHHGRWLDQALQFVALTMISVPPFWTGILAILLFSVTLGWLPVIGDGGMLPSVLPVTCLGLVVAVPILRIVRDGILEGLHEPYVTTLRAKGLGERRVFFVHVLRNAMIATITLLSVYVGELLSGAVVMETLFARQGIGRVTVEALNQKDIPVVQGAILLASVTYVLINLLVDLSYTWIDPRTRLAQARGSR